MPTHTLRDMSVTTVHTVDVMRHGDKIQIPPSLTLEDAIVVLERLKHEEEQETALSATFNVFPWDGACAFARAMDEKFGWFGRERTPIMTMFGPSGSKPPQEIEVEIDFGKTARIPWGRFSLPGIEGWIETGADYNGTMVIFKVQANVKKKHSDQINDLFQRTRENLAKDSIYKGKAIKIRFFNDDDERLPLPTPRFLDVRDANEGDLVLSKDVWLSIKTNLFTPIERMKVCKRFGIPTKRGVLMCGYYGCGKTLAAYVAANKAVQNGITFLLCTRANEFADAVQFASQYAPAVVFCEDIDKVVSGERNISIDEILNVVDGIESKSSEIMVVLTTNQVEKIHKAMLRPGRLDAVVHITPPDAEATERLIRKYGGDLIPKDEDLTEVSQKLQGNIPAIIRECVERSKLSAIALMQDSDLVTNTLQITSVAIGNAVTTMKVQLDLLKEDEKKEETDAEKFGRGFGKVVAMEFDKALAQTAGNHVNGIAALS